MPFALISSLHAEHPLKAASRGAPSIRAFYGEPAVSANIAKTADWNFCPTLQHALPEGHKSGRYWRSRQNAENRRKIKQNQRRFWDTHGLCGSLENNRLYTKMGHLLCPHRKKNPGSAATETGIKSKTKASSFPIYITPRTAAKATGIQGGHRLSGGAL